MVATGVKRQTMQMGVSRFAFTALRGSRNGGGTQRSAKSRPVIKYAK